jgi:hypothetical protein
VDRQLQAIVDDLEVARQRVRALHADVPRAVWDRRPAPGCWSPAECIEHLNLTSEALLPLLRVGLQEAREGEPRSLGRYRRDLVGWIIWTIMAPVRGWKTKTIGAFVPTGTTPAERLIADFERLQAEIMTLVGDADGLPIDRIILVSPVDQRLKYNLYSMFTLVPRHQHRHLLQAWRAARVFEAVPASALAV